MTPQLFTSTVSQRFSRALAVTALVLGLGSAVLTPDAALAAPAPAMGSDFEPYIWSKDQDMPVGKRFKIAVTMQNTGNLSATAKVRVFFGSDVKAPRLTWDTSEGWKCGQVMALNDDRHVVNCERFNLRGGFSASFVAEGTIGDGQRNFLTVMADPDQEVGELNEANNLASVYLR